MGYNFYNPVRGTCASPDYELAFVAYDAHASLYYGFVLLGHTIDVTMIIYTHVTAELKREVIKK